MQENCTVLGELSVSTLRVSAPVPQFPVKPNGKAPLTSHGFKDASSDQRQIKAWERAYPGCNWGMPTGEVSGLVVIDLDAKNGNDGFPEWYELLSRHGFSETREVFTPSGGMHIYYRQPEGVKLKSTAGEIGKGIDTRAEGGYVVVPPSSIDGSAYEWVCRDTPIAALPDWLLAIWPKQGEPRQQRNADGSTSPVPPTPIGITLTAGERHAGLVSVALQHWRTAKDQAQLLAVMWQYNQRWCTPPQHFDEVAAICEWVARRKRDDDSPLNFDEIAATIGAGTAQPFFRPGARRLEKHVRETVSTIKPPNRLPDKPTRKGPRPTLWAEAAERFKFPNGVKPLTKSTALFSAREGRLIIVDLFSNSWRNKVNAQHKRRKLYFNLFPRLSAHELYSLEVPIDDWTPPRHEAIRKAIYRAKGEHLWFNNALKRGVAIYCCNIQLAGWTHVSDVKGALVQALNAIEPDDAGQRFRPYGGSRGWTSAAMAPVESDGNSWELIGKSDTRTDYIQIEAEAVASGIKCEYTSTYWRGQWGNGLLLDFPTVDLAQAFVHGLGYKLKGLIGDGLIAGAGRNNGPGQPRG